MVHFITIQQGKERIFNLMSLVPPLVTPHTDAAIITSTFCHVQHRDVAMVSTVLVISKVGDVVTGNGVHGVATFSVQLGRKMYAPDAWPGFSLLATLPSLELYHAHVWRWAGIEHTKL